MSESHGQKEIHPPLHESTILPQARHDSSKVSEWVSE